MTNLDYLYNKEAAKRAFVENYFVGKKMSFQTIENGMILPHKDVIVDGVWTWGSGGVVDSAGVFIAGSSVKSDVGKNYTPPPDEIHYQHETVIYIGLFYHAWGHFITDSIRRLWFLKSEYVRNEFKTCPIVYLTWLGRKIDFSTQNFRRLLEILEVDIDKFQLIEKPTRFDKIILPDESFYVDHGKRFTNEYRETIEQIRHFALKNRTPIPNRKIYYLHAMRTQVGEERLADYFHSKGYEIIRPERLNVDEQLNLLINCESFVSTVGSTSHNSIFLRDNTEAIYIPRYINRFTEYQLTIDQVHPLNIFYVDSTLSICATWTDFSCYIISEQIKRFFGDKFYGYEEDDFKAFLQYVKDSINRGSGISLGIKNAYGTTFADFFEQLSRRKDLMASYDMPSHWEELRPLLTYQTHVASKGWSSWNSEEQISNDIEQSFQIEAIKINFPSHKVYYSVYYNDEERWTEEVTNGQVAGTTGKFKPIYGMKIRLDEAGAKKFDIVYRMHKFDGEWTAWAKNGEEIISNGVKLNSIQIRLKSK